MNIAIIGSRTFTDYRLMCRECKKLGISSIVSGGARGADSLAAKYAQSSGIPIRIYRPDYRRYGRRAPIIRNTRIIQSCSRVLAFWDGCSRGTYHAISYAERQGVPVIVVRYK